MRQRARSPQDEFSALVEDAQTPGKRGGDVLAQAERRIALSEVRDAGSLGALHSRALHPRERASLGLRAGPIRDEPPRSPANTELMEAFLRGGSPRSVRSSGPARCSTRTSRGASSDSIRCSESSRAPPAARGGDHPRREAETRGRVDRRAEERADAVLRRRHVELRPLNELFGLNLVRSSTTPSRDTSVFRQILLRISGSHESLRATYTRRFGARRWAAHSFYADEGPARRGAGREASPPEERRARGPTEPARDRTRPKRSSRHRHRPAPKPAKPKPKSHRRDRPDLEEFDKALHTKPSEKDSS